MSIPGGLSVLRRASNQRPADGIPTLKPIRVPSRLAMGSRTGSASSTPRHGGTPRLNKRRRRGLFFVLQLLALLSLALIVLKQADGFGGRSSSDSSAHVRKRQLISDAWQDPQQVGLASETEDRSQRLQALADALLAENANPEVSMHPSDSPISEVFAHPTTGPSGSKVSYFYRFTNVRFSDGGIDVYAGPERSQPKDSAFDLVQVDATSLQPPTSILLRDTGADLSTTRSIPVRYLAQQRPAAACTDWVEEPAMLIHSTAPDDMWHTWTEGLIPAFQTLRELGYLPLMEVSKEGAIKEVTEGIPVKQCPQVAVTATGAVLQATDCSQIKGLGAPAPESCTVGNQTWCIPGTWPHTTAARSKKPAMVFFDEKVLDNEWGSLYTSMAGSVRAFDGAQGTCFRNLIVGTTRTLSVTEGLPSGGEGGDPKARLDNMAAALEVFRRFVRSAQHRLKVTNAIEFLGYTDFYRERLRTGVQFGKSNIIDHSFEEPLAVAEDSGASASLLEDWNELKQQPWMFSTDRQSLTPKAEITAVEEEAAANIQQSPIGRYKSWQPEEPLPVVTYMTRWNDLDRAVLNDRQVLRYIYWKYNVTLRVTSLDEHVDAVADLLSRTDVLIGVHGAGWAHAMFLKQGAASLQLLPYGWRRTDGSLLRGGSVGTMVHFRRGTHLNWVNPHGRYSFFRRQDFESDPEDFRRHPEEPTNGGEWAEPQSNNPHPAWLNANTYADLNHLGPYIDEVMRAAGVPEMDPAVFAQVREAKLQKQMAKRARQNMIQTDAADGDNGNAAAGAWEASDGDPIAVDAAEEAIEKAWEEEVDDEDEEPLQDYATPLADDYDNGLEEDDDDASVSAEDAAEGEVDDYVGDAATVR